MRKALNFIGIGISILVTVFYLIAALTPYVSPVKFPAITLFTIGYLPILLAYTILVVCWCFIKRRIGLLLALLFFTGYKNVGSTVGFHIFSPAWQTTKDSSSIRIMCWNVNYMGNPFISADTPGNNRRDILGFIEKQQPDILCLQDFSSVREGTTKNVFHKNLETILQKGNFSTFYFPYTYDYNGTNYSDMYGVVFFSKYPIVDSGSFAVLKEPREEKAGFVDIRKDGRTFRIYNAHLASMALWPNKDGEAGLHYLEGDSTRKKTLTLISKLNYFGKVHAAQAETIREQVVRSPHPVILSADLNEVPSGYVYHHLKEGLYDAFLENDFGIGGTYNLVFPKIRIDVLFHSADIEVTRYTRPAVNFSDHFPIIADIRWKK